MTHDTEACPYCRSWWRKVDEISLEAPVRRQTRARKKSAASDSDGTRRAETRRRLGCLSTSKRSAEGNRPTPASHRETQSNDC
jgi:hypothetical protein